MGHQYRAIAGYAIERSNFASLKICEDVKEDEKVFHQGQYYKWKDFKAKFPTWTFDSQKVVEADKMERIRGHLAVIWNTIGKDLCAEYRYVQHVQLSF